MTLHRLVNPIACRACGVLLAASAVVSSLVRRAFWTVNGERR